MTTNTLSDATETHIETINLRAYNDTAREMERSGIRLTHEQADEIGEQGCDWLRNRLGLKMETDGEGVSFEVCA